MSSPSGITLFCALMFASAHSAYATGHGMTAADVKFMQTAVSGSRMEVEIGKYAESHGQAKVVKDFGSKMATDHQKAVDELTDMGKSKDVKLPTDMTAKQKDDVDALKKLDGADFDRAYIKSMVRDHTMDVAAFRRGVRSVKDPDLKAWAALTLPVLESHLKMAKEAQAQLNSGRAVTIGAKP